MAAQQEERDNSIFNRDFISSIRSALVPYGIPRIQLTLDYKDLIISTFGWGNFADTSFTRLFLYAIQVSESQMWELVLGNITLHYSFQSLKKALEHLPSMTHTAQASGRPNCLSNYPSPLASMASISLLRNMCTAIGSQPMCNYIYKMHSRHFHLNFWACTILCICVSSSRCLIRRMSRGSSVIWRHY